MPDFSDTERRLIELAPSYRIIGGRSKNFCQKFGVLK